MLIRQDIVNVEAAEVSQRPRALDETSHCVASALASEPRQRTDIAGHVEVDVDAEERRNRLQIGAFTQPGQKLLRKTGVLFLAYIGSSMAFAGADPRRFSARCIPRHGLIMRNARCANGRWRLDVGTDDRLLPCIGLIRLVLLLAKSVRRPG